MIVKPMVVLAARCLGPGRLRLQMVKLAHEMTHAKPGDKRAELVRLDVGPQPVGAGRQVRSCRPVSDPSVCPQPAVKTVTAPAYARGPSNSGSRQSWSSCSVAR